MSRWIKSNVLWADGSKTPVRLKKSKDGTIKLINIDLSLTKLLRKLKNK